MNDRQISAVNRKIAPFKPCPRMWTGGMGMPSTGVTRNGDPEREKKTGGKVTGPEKRSLRIIKIGKKSHGGKSRKEKNHLDDQGKGEGEEKGVLEKQGKKKRKTPKRVRKSAENATMVVGKPRKRRGKKSKSEKA